MILRMLKDARWCINFKGTNLKKGQLVKILNEQLAENMINSKHAEKYVEKTEVPAYPEDEKKIIDRLVEETETIEPMVEKTIDEAIEEVKKENKVEKPKYKGTNKKKVKK